MGVQAPSAALKTANAGAEDGGSRVGACPSRACVWRLPSPRVRGETQGSDVGSDMEHPPAGAAVAGIGRGLRGGGGKAVGLGAS